MGNVGAKWLLSGVWCSDTPETSTGVPSTDGAVSSRFETKLHSYRSQTRNIVGYRLHSAPESWPAINNHCNHK